ncbi:adenylosuccinate lyase family protein [Shigella boydii]|uniref:class-II fumarase/aspartase family protein n=1 Tax=Shigella boydii TaxID=621 RepID=UPI0002674131|nr:adenylosuccinate lyase family protein [Shigella boydii]EFP4109134.1 adenylosuccinate lyase family protein [Shigella boydii]EFX6400583.1 adenylosuccinate lyase family protein [Shigella boydii]EFY9970669.1 adenylosuccinate lyase family protein [Shigella boydii]EFY9991433.1 adenylosuccinate lyase family protein [Shigella boydii]EFZ6316646.1 adenylosuccinate lyase family protein [Shigella boydii]
MYGKQTTVFDSDLYSSLFTQEDMRDIWSDNNLLRCWLRFETTVARTQSDLGIIPQQAADDIEQACCELNVDWPALAQGTRNVGMAIKPFIDQIASSGTPLVSQYLHWGCTTQDLLDTGLAMRLQQSLQLIYQQVISLGDEMKNMALHHARTVMVARTNSVDASATTWGLHVSGYLVEICRHLQRLQQIYPRAITGLFGGAVGNLASVGEQGIELRARLMQALGLNTPCGINNASQDTIVEVVQCFALIHGTLCRLANDIETMGRTPIAEVFEGEGGGGSSTMPHKANPRASNMIQTLARMGWMYASGAPAMLDQQDVRAASMRVLNWTILPEVSQTISTSLMRAKNMLSHLKINAEKMRDNFNCSKYFIMSESLTMSLARKIGREPAYNLVKNILNHASGEYDFISIARTNSDIVKILTIEEIIEACDPVSYIGCNDDLITETVNHFNQIKTISLL